ncbi:MAG: hypothetical protein R3F37_10925 [Candidatus Competibacteraceae bacterium]
MYAAGRGVRQNDSEAVKWYRQAAERGHAEAQNNLEVRYATGRAFPKTTKKRPNGIVGLPNRALPKPKTI